jgi:hypothetical protein
VAVRSCAGAYASGAAGSNICPAGSVRIVTEGVCRIAAAAVGKTIPASYFVMTNPDFPRGCFYEGGTAYFNTHAVGEGRSDAQLLCKPGAPTA